MHVRSDLADLAPLDLAPHHERIHRAFDVSRAVLFSLRMRREKKSKVRIVCSVFEFDFFGELISYYFPIY